MLDKIDPYIAGAGLIACLAIWRLYRALQAFSAFKLPTLTMVISPVYIWGRVTPRIPGIAAGPTFGWKNAYESIFGKRHSDVIVVRSLVPMTPHILLADVTATKVMYGNRAAFPKPERNYKSGQKYGYGPNLVSSEHDEWRKHRRIAGPSFTEGNNRLVWEASLEIILGYFTKWNRDGKGAVVKVDDFNAVTTQIAYMVFATAGFGMNVNWDWDKSQVPKGHIIPFMEALHSAAEGFTLRIAFPKWMISLTKRGRRALLGYDEMERYMLEMIEERKSSTVLEDRNDLLSNLIRASLDEKLAGGKEYQFDQRDLLGNIFIFLVAGHETTASSLAFATALLAIYQDEQEELYKHIRSVIPEGRLPTYQDIPRLTRVLAVISETLRLYPPVSFTVKEAAEDCVVPTHTGRQLPVPKGTNMFAMISAIQHNEKYWPEPYEFRPSRFLGDYNKDAYLSFSSGARACIGRRFSEIEQIAVLSVIVLHYKIDVLEEPQYAHETPAERKARVLAEHRPLLVKPRRVPVVFTPREGVSVMGY